MAWLYYLILFIVLIAGWLMTIVTLPGLWLMAGALAAFGLITGWDRYVGWHSVIAMLVLAGIAEVIELGAGAAGSKVGGGRRRGMIGALIGGVVGAICLTGLVPIPVVGTIIGVCLGTFLGAAIAELSDRGVGHSMRVGAGAAGGRLAGILAKLAFGFLMLLVGMIAALPIGRGSAATIPPATVLVPRLVPASLPASLPATLPTTLP